MRQRDRVMKVASEEKRIVYGAVYVPGEVDSDWETMTAEDVEKAAHGFLMSGKVDRIDFMHDGQPTGARVVESYLSKEGDPDFPVPGTWVLGVHVPDDALWEAIKKGEVNGFSMAGRVQKVPKRVVVEVVSKAVGETLEAEGHTHEFVVEFDEEGRVVFGKTSEVEGHVHEIKGTSVTEKAEGHAHRYVL